MKAKEHFCKRACRTLARRERIEFRSEACARCGKIVTRRAATFKNKKRFFCSPECTRAAARESLAEKHPHGPNFKGGTYVTSNGYRLVLHPDHPDADAKGYIFEHRFVMSEVLGRLLSETEIVHHRDGDKLNNAPENLEIIDRSSHAILHGLGTYIRSHG